MKVSIIISTRNRPELLIRRSLLSACIQDIQHPYQVIIIDDASEDNIEKIVSDFYKLRIKDYTNIPRTRYYRNTKRMGLAYNKNLGIQMAKGEYIVFLDDDNDIHMDFLRKTTEYLDIHPEVSSVGVCKNIIYPEEKVCEIPKLPCSINDGFLIRKEVFEKIKFDEELHANEDADFGIRFFKEGFEMAIIHEPLMTVYGSPIINTTSYSDYSDYHLDGLAKFWLKHHEYKQYIGRIFLLSAGKPQWFKFLYWLEEKIKRYYRIWTTRIKNYSKS